MNFLHKLRFLKDKVDRKRLENKNFSIFSNNCIGGVIYHSLGLQFLSPTINLWMSPSDYIEMLKDPKKYFINGKMKEVRIEEIDYPVGEIEGKRIYGQHYSNFNELKDKWDERKKRINWDNVYVFMIERDGCTYKDLVNFDKLPYEHKVIFTTKSYPEIKSSLVLPNSYDTNNNNVNNLLVYKSTFSVLRILDEYDYVDFFNNKGSHLR